MTIEPVAKFFQGPSSEPPLGKGKAPPQIPPFVFCRPLRSADPSYVNIEYNNLIKGVCRVSLQEIIPLSHKTRGSNHYIYSQVSRTVGK